ncbi:hypothetical protein AAG570_003282 [Ranatra chinensis]|uniref:Uncharacterized protein n=1 Tax=Ranatra chinensis TaxID=642074 RepID=A0ABD0Y6T7_9HEMI
MHAFPLEKSAGGITENIQFKEKQFKEIVDLLVDDYHFVRIIAIRGVCHHLMETIECFAVIEVKTLLKTLADTLANDGSTYLVRLAVFEGFAEMVKKKESAQLLESILPQMKLHIHDENEKVRCAFVKILQNVKDHPDTMSIKYWDIVPIDHLAARLEVNPIIF